MKTLSLLLSVSFLLLTLTSCDSTSERMANSSSQPVATKAEPQAEADAKGYIAAKEVSPIKEVSLTDNVKTEETSAAADRKIVRNADLTMEVASTTDTQHRVVSIAEAHGGFVVTSEAKQKENVEPSKRTFDIKLVIRVPEHQFGAALDQIRGLGSNLKEEKVTGQDVTEEFIDLEARIKTQKALEMQFMQIMKQAGKIEDALEVQRQIAEVRTNIERLEGRKRFLENRSSLATITVNIQTPVPIVVSTTGFRHSVREAVSDSVELGSEIVIFFVRFVIVTLPVFVLLLLPGALVLRYFMRRAERMRLAEALEAPASE